MCKRRGKKLIYFLQHVLFNIDELCPTNAPKRCEWCKGPHHIRKRCPKLATLVYEDEKQKRFDKKTEEKYSSSRYSNKNHSNDNRRNYPHSAPTNQQQFRYSNNQDRSNEQYKTNSYRSHQQNNTNRQCFICGKSDHLKAQCPNKKANFNQQQFSS